MTSAGKWSLQGNEVLQLCLRLPQCFQTASESALSALSMTQCLWVCLDRFIFLDWTESPLCLSFKLRISQTKQ